MDFVNEDKNASYSSYSGRLGRSIRMVWRSPASTTTSATGSAPNAAIELPSSDPTFLSLFGRGVAYLALIGAMSAIFFLVFTIFHHGWKISKWIRVRYEGFIRTEVQVLWVNNRALPRYYAAPRLSSRLRRMSARFATTTPGIGAIVELVAAGFVGPYLVVSWIYPSLGEPREFISLNPLSLL